MAVSKALADEKLSTAYKKYYNDILKYCNLRLSKNLSAVDDCVQDVFLVYYNKVLAGEEILNVRAYLYRTADYVCKGAETAFLRRAKKTVPLENAVDVAVTEIDEKVSLIDYDLLKELLINKLTQPEQELYTLKFEQDKSIKEIAKLLNIPLSAAAKRSSRLRIKIKALISLVIEDYEKGGVAP